MPRRFQLVVAGVALLVGVAVPAAADTERTAKVNWPTITTYGHEIACQPSLRTPTVTVRLIHGDARVIHMRVRGTQAIVDTVTGYEGMGPRSLFADVALEPGGRVQYDIAAKVPGQPGESLLATHSFGLDSACAP